MLSKTRSGLPVTNITSKTTTLDTSADFDKEYETVVGKAMTLLQHEGEKDLKIAENERMYWNMLQHLRCMTIKNGLDIPLKIEYPHTYQFYNYSAGIRPHNSSGMQCCWIIENISTLIREKVVISQNKLPGSPPWLTDGGSYCMQAFLYPNGLDDFISTHVSVFVSIIPGPNDGKLTWPAFGKISAFVKKQHSHIPG